MGVASAEVIRVGVAYWKSLKWEWPQETAVGVALRDHYIKSGCSYLKSLWWEWSRGVVRVGVVSGVSLGLLVCGSGLYRGPRVGVVF